MTLSNGGAFFFITIGCVSFVLTATSFICGCIAMSKLYGVKTAEATGGFLGLYFIAPGVLCILSGCKQGRAVLGATLATNTMGIIFAIGGMINSALFWALRNDGDERCVRYKFYHFMNELSCSDLDTVRSLHGTITIVFALFIIIGFAGSIYGCVGTCCTAQDYTLVSNEPGQATVMVMTTTNESSQQSSQAYSQPPPYPQTGISGQDRTGNINHGQGELVNV